MEVNKLTHQEQAYNKIQQLNQEIEELQNYIRMLELPFQISFHKSESCSHFQTIT